MASIAGVGLLSLGSGSVSAGLLSDLSAVLHENLLPINACTRNICHSIRLTSYSVQPYNSGSGVFSYSCGFDLFSMAPSHRDQPDIPLREDKRYTKNAAYDSSTQVNGNVHGLRTSESWYDRSSNVRMQVTCRPLTILSMHSQWEQHFSLYVSYYLRPVEPRSTRYQSSNREHWKSITTATAN